MDKERVFEKIDQLLNYLKDGVEFGKEQMPLLAHEIITVGIAWNSIMVCVSLMVIAATVKWCWWLHTTARDRQWDSDIYTVVTVCAILGGGVPAVAMLRWVYQLLLGILAPRLYLVEYIRGVLN